MGLGGTVLANLGAVSFTAISIALVAYLFYWVLHPEGP